MNTIHQQSASNWPNLAATDPAERVSAALRSFAAAGLPRVLLVTHAWGGGIEEHVTLLASMLTGRARVMVMRPVGDHCVELELPESVCFRAASDPWQALVNALQMLDFARVHLHHIQGLPSTILNIDEALGVPLDFTLHDYVSICPQNHLVDSEGQYCGEPDDVGCNRCIAKRPHAWQKSIERWRSDFAVMLRRADRVFAPSYSVARTIGQYFPTVAITTAAPPEAALPPPRVVKVALLGGLSRAKGLGVAIDVAALAQAKSSPVLLRLIGHAAEPLPPALPFQATGSYAPAELPTLIAVERPDVIWLPSQVPETFSYTLTAALDSGIPIVASDIGALPNRLHGNANATLLSPASSPAEWHDALLAASARSSQWLGMVEVDDAAVAPSLRQQRSAHATAYVERYLAVLPPAGKITTAAPLLQLQLQAHSVQAPDTDSRRTDALTILDALRMGIYAGHRESMQGVERALTSLPAGETQVVGRMQYQSLADERDSVTRALHALRHEFAANVEQNLRQQTAAELAQQQASAARAHIAHLEASVQQQKVHLSKLKVENDVLLSSWSLRITRPLRKMASAARRMRHIGAATVKLIPRIPALSGRAMERYRRGGWRSLRDRMLLEVQPVVTAATVVLPDTTLAPVSALTLNTTADRPIVSILIPVYGQHETTFACLKSIHAHPTRRAFEVIVMDDCSPAPAAEALAAVNGIRIIRNERNLGFIGNVNAAAKAATGAWLIILNNDIVLREGALDALLATFDAHQNIGLVGAKLLSVDGSVQEAGGIVWRDASAWNWGRGFDREDPRVNYLRDADYCSGAALAIKRELFSDLGGFDPHYAPAYYEDTDLAFRIRDKGLRVVYQPAAEIFHFEGVSHGRDESSGIKAYQAENAKKFYARWQQTLLAHGDNAAQPEREIHRSKRSNILIVEACMITPDQDSGSVRMLNLIRMLLNDGHHVSFVADNLDGDAKYAAALTTMGVEVLHGRFAGSVKNVLRQRGATLDTIVFCRYYIAIQYVNTVRTLAPHARIVFDTVDLHYLREEREATLTGEAAMHRSAASTRSKEIAVMEKCDITVVVSAVEKALLAKLLPHVHVEVISNINPPATESQAGLATTNVQDFDLRQGILFIGGFRHPPNVDAIKWYVTHVLPLLRELLPNVVTTVVGSHMPAEITTLQRDSLLIKGFVPDTALLLRAARVSIAPLRYGSGVKGKINEAMNHGIPVVATSSAVEAMQLQDGLDVLVADSAADFAHAIARLHTDAALWAQLSAAGRINVQTHFSPEAAQAAVRSVFSRE